MNEELELIASIDPSLLWSAVGFSLILISILAGVSFRPTKKAKAPEEEKPLAPSVEGITNIVIPAEELALADSIPEEIRAEILEDIQEEIIVKPVLAQPVATVKGGEVKKGLKQSRGFFSKKIATIFGIGKADRSLESLLNDFEELLLEGDIGINTSQKLVAKVKAHLLENKPESKDILSEQVGDLLREEVISILHSDDIPEIDPVKVNGGPKVVVVVGVNGAGKTTTIGKLAFQFGAQGAKVLVGACDTFRAAATDQLEVWAERAGAGIEKGADGEKPSTVAYRTIHRGKAEGYDIVLIDTAGRLHNKVNLMSELSSITKIISREQEGAPHETFLVVDGTTGQNALFQAKQFNEATTLSGIVVTKLDGTPKGGIVVAIKNELGIPVRYIGMGEGAGDLRPFEASEFVDALFTEDERGDLSYSNLEVGSRAIV